MLIMAENGASTSAINNEELMEHIRRYPVIYDKSAAHYRDARKRANAFKAIEQAMKLEAGDALKRYSTVRTRFSKYLKSLQLPSGSGNTVTLNSEYESLRWLICHIKPKSNTSSNYSRKRSQQNEEEAPTTEDTPEEQPSEAARDSEEDVIFPSSQGSYNNYNNK